jgi:hypothetical protein
MANNNSYISFDGTSIRDLIVQRLNEGQIFTDQNYQGSNLSALIDVISYTFSTLLYYLNKTSSESLFSEAQIYENMNRIVKLLNYNPVGKVTQTVGYNINSTTSLPAGNYIIPRYTYLSVGGTNFSVNNDIYFTNTADGLIHLQNQISDLFLYQGQFQEYPTYNALGNNNEVLYLNLGTSTYIDHFNIFVYVKDINTGTWSQWSQTQNLFLNKSTDKVYELRYNPNQNYEIKFGDNINGKSLNINDNVIVYYLNLDPDAQTIAANTINTSSLIPYNSVNFSQIQNDILTSSQISSLLTSDQIKYISLSNEYPSNPYSQEESVDQIRSNASKNFSYQQRLVTVLDFKNFIKNNYNNIISDVHVVNNDDYLTGHLKYLYDIGLNYPQLDGRVLYNQVQFANSCNFNNIYVYLVPLNATQQYVNAAQKELILNDLQGGKVLTSQVVPIDPVYMDIDFYVKSPLSEVNINDISKCKLLIRKSSNTRRASSGILNDVIKIINSYFNNTTSTLGQMIDINQLSTNLANVDGIESFQTYRSDTDTYVNGLSLIIWNETYPNLDAKVTAQNVQLQYFQYPKLNNITNLISRIEIIEPSGVIQVTDY